MMVISSKPKQSHPLIPHPLSLPLSLSLPISLTPKSSSTLSHSSPPLSASHTPHIDRAHFFTVPELQFKTHFSLFAVNPYTHNF